MRTIGRLVSLYPAAEQSSARVRLADNLQSVISQRLIPSADGKKVVAQEIMVNNLGIQECIMDQNKTSEIKGFIEKGKEVSGMQTFDQHLGDLVNNRSITMETALEYATNPSDFQRNFSFGGTVNDLDGTSGAPEGAGLQLEAQEPPPSPPAAKEEKSPTPPPPLIKPPNPSAGATPPKPLVKKPNAA
jgi:hypothetical protein